jgi:hypothetical protein
MSENFLTMSDPRVSVHDTTPILGLSMHDTPAILCVNPRRTHADLRLPSLLQPNQKVFAAASWIDRLLPLTFPFPRIT